MKIDRACDAVSTDTSDSLAQKAHVIPDQDWHPLMDALRDAVLDADLAPDTCRAAWLRAWTAFSDANRLF